ncbi:MAG: ABC transporter substrate-binding protein [Tissierellia bacterium]|nr:ABC transporter substrate-binding protein [Tissierellia bacterium]
MKKIISILLIFTLLLPLSACGGKEETKSNELKEITFVLDWTPNTNHTGIYVAQEKGFYEEQGLKVNIVQPPEDGAESLVAGGKAEYGVSFQDIMATAWSKEDPLPITAILAIINHNTSGILSGKDKNILSPKDMQGHNYATWDDPIEQAILKNVIEKDGGDFSKVEMLPSTVTDAVSALQTNVDSLWVYYAWDGIATEVKEVPTNYFEFIDINPVFDYYSPFIIGNNKYMEEHPEEVKAFLKATVEGYTFAMEHPEEAAEILCKANPEIDEELAKASQVWLADKYQEDAPRFGEFDKDRWNNFYQWLWEEKLIEREIEQDFGFTNEFLPE